MLKKEMRENKILNKCNIRFLVMDVDGTLTDGKIYMGNDGELFKAFDIKDGYGISLLLPQHGIVPVVITARESKIVEHRCKELNITEIHQGTRAKLECLLHILERYSSVDNVHYTLANVAYIGDDLLNLQCIRPIKQSGGLTGCPADAAQSVADICDYISTHKAGDRAVRDFIEHIILEQNI